MKNKKLESNEKKSAEMREKIYKSAETLFREHGFEDTSVNMIIQKAGVSKGSFYIHYVSKDSLVVDYITNTIGWMDLSYEAVINSFAEGVPAFDILLSLVERVANNITVDLGYTIIQTVGLIQIRKSVNFELLINFNKGLYKSIYKIIKKGIERGEFKTGDSAETIAEDIATTIRGFIFEWILRYPDMDLKAFLQKHFKIYLAGL